MMNTTHSHPVFPVSKPGILQEQEEELLENPRIMFQKAVRAGDLRTCLIKTAEIHGHYCPGSALGVMASVYGIQGLGYEACRTDGVMEELLAIVEINACFADGIQAVSGCTLGNNSLIYRDLGKFAVTFAIRGRKEGIRIRVCSRFPEFIEEAVPEFYPLMRTVILNREGGPEEVKEFRRTGRKAAFALIGLPFDQLFERETVIPDIPDYAPITASLVCPDCGETIMATKTRRRGLQKGKCFQCSGTCYQLDGSGISRKKMR